MQQLQEDRYTTRLQSQPEQIARRDRVIHGDGEASP
ncbi:MAG TPA: ectoine hydroxylase, partial [Henriciella marina]|nr:ectoine hydroxylase [Henriciella marina]